MSICARTSRSARPPALGRALGAWRSHAADAAAQAAAARRHPVLGAAQGQRAEREARRAETQRLAAEHAAALALARPRRSFWAQAAIGSPRFIAAADIPLGALEGDARLEGPARDAAGAARRGLLSAQLSAAGSQWEARKALLGGLGRWRGARSRKGARGVRRRWRAANG